MAGHAAPNIVEDGLVFLIDAANPSSFISGSDKCFSLVNSNLTGSVNDGLSSINENAGVFEFDGADDDMLLMPPTSLSNFTFQSWIYQPTGGSNYYQYIRYVNSSNTIWWYIGDLSGLSSGAGQRTWIGSSYREGTPVIPRNQWVNCAVVLDSEANTLNHYYNGELSNNGDVGMANTPGTPGTANYIWRGKTPGLMVYDKA